MATLKTWATTKYFQTMKKKPTQLELYVKNNSDADTLTLVSMANKVFGEEVMEPMIRELFQMSPKENKKHDGIRLGKKIEIKSARWHATGKDCNWQHLEPDYDYEFVLFVLVDFTELKVWVITKEKLMGELRAKNIVSKQGEQGWTTNKKKIEPYLTPLSSIDDLDRFIKEHSSESKMSPPPIDE